MSDRDLAMIVGRRYEILRALHPENEYTLSELTTKLETDQGNLSRYITDLEDKGLVETIERERERGRPLKYIKLAEHARDIVTSMIKTMQLAGKGKPREWQINETINTLEDSNLGDELREDAAHTFFRFCQDYPIRMIENEKAMKCFKEVVANPLKYGEKIDERLRASISSSFNRLLSDKKWLGWILKELYPLLLQHMENQEESVEIRVWATKRVADIAIHEKKKALYSKLLETWFTSDPDSELEKEVKQQIFSIASNHQGAYEMVRERAKSKNSVEKRKAESLLKEIITLWRPSILLAS